MKRNAFTLAELLPWYIGVHTGGENVAFTDGHVKWEAMAKMLGMGGPTRFAGSYLCSNGIGGFYHNNGDVDEQPLQSTNIDPPFESSSVAWKLSVINGNAPGRVLAASSFDDAASLLHFA